MHDRSARVDTLLRWLVSVIALCPHAPHARCAKQSLAEQAASLRDTVAVFTLD